MSVRWNQAHLIPYKWMRLYCFEFSVLQLRQRPTKQYKRKKELKEGRHLSHHPDGKILTLNLVKTWLERMSKLCTSWVWQATHVDDSNCEQKVSEKKKTFEIFNCSKFKASKMAHFQSLRWLKSSVPFMGGFVDWTVVETPHVISDE